MIGLLIKQSWLEKSSETALEEFKATFLDVLNSFPSDRHTEARWSISKISEGEAAQLFYDERPIASLKIEDKVLHLKSHENEVPLLQKRRERQTPDGQSTFG